MFLACEVGDDNESIRFATSAGSGCPRGIKSLQMIVLYSDQENSLLPEI
jgi:hypothetical protein